MRKIRLLIFMFGIALATACSGPATKADTSPAEGAAPETLPGTSAWNSGALKLPTNSPVVMSGQIDRLGRAVVELKDWVSADPAMFGEPGDELIGQLDVYWSLVVAFFGGEVNDPQVWKRRGIDPDRSMHLGFYPLDQQGEALLKRADESVRSSFGFGPAVSLGDALMGFAEKQGEVPTGFNSALKRDIETFQPLTGMRLVVPLAEESAFTSFFLNLIDSFEYREEKVAGRKARVFSDSGEFPAVQLSFDGSHALIDIVIAPVDVSTVVQEEEERRATVRAMMMATERFVAGRPAAPAPLDDPALSLSFYQPAVAKLARLRGYQRSLTTARNLSAEDRDNAVFVGVARTERLAQNWYGPQSGFDGLVYGMEIGAPETNRIAGITMSFFGPKGSGALPVETPAIGLGVEDRSFGLSIDFGPLYQSDWQAWVALDEPRKQLDLFDEGDFDPLVFALTMPRNVALIAGNLATDENDESGLSELLQTELPNVARAEIAALSPDLSGLYSAPKIASLFVMRDDMDPRLLEVSAQAARDFVVATTASLVGADVDIDQLPPLSPGATTLRPAGLPPHYVDWQPGDVPRLMVVVGLDDPSAAAEVAKLATQDPDKRDEVMFFFARPSAFVELLSGDGMERLKLVDAPILAQRLGPVVAWIKPREVSDAAAIHFKVELRRPPAL